MERIEKKTKVKGEKNNMAANVETMFSVREKPWHGLGVVVEEAPSSEEALRLAGLDWRVVQKSLYTNSGLVDGYKANVRESDNTVLGVVTDRYCSIGDVLFVTRSVPVSRLRQVTLLVTEGHSSIQVTLFETKGTSPTQRWENFRTWLMIIWVQKQGNEID